MNYIKELLDKQSKDHGYTIFKRVLFKRNGEKVPATLCKHSHRRNKNFIVTDEKFPELHEGPFYGDELNHRCWYVNKYDYEIIKGFVF